MFQLPPESIDFFPKSEVQGPEWYLSEEDDHKALVLRTKEGNTILLGLADFGFPEDKDRVKIFDHIKQSFMFLRGKK